MRDSIPNSSAGGAGPPVPGPGWGARTLLASLLLLLTLAVFLPLSGHDFVIYGDDLWITNNKQVQSGLNVDSVGYAFTSVQDGLWVPLARISALADAEIFGMKAGGHHLTSLALHGTAAVLFFLALASMTGAPGRSFAAAALYAVHPLNVEAVAWAAARPYVLGAFFWMLTLLLYHRYAGKPDPLRWLVLAGVFACGLMASPLLAALPLVLVLLDIWPLGRLPWGGRFSQAAPARYPAMPVREIIEEKVPLAAMALVTVMVNVSFGTKGTAGSLGEAALPARLSEALPAALWYVQKAYWPGGLAVTYPTAAGSALFMKSALAILLLAVVTYLALRYRLKVPAVTLGWLWYLLVLGFLLLLTPAAVSLTADRHAGLPLAGLLIMVSWGVPALAGGRVPARALQGAAVLLVAVLAISSGRQVRFWSDSDTLFNRALAVNGDSSAVHRIYGKALTRAGEKEEALRHLREALSADPGSANTRWEMAAILNDLGREEEALEEYRTLLEANPENHRIASRLGSELARSRRYEEAEPILREALLLRPDHTRTMRNLATTLLRQEKYEEAALLYRRALAIEPKHDRAERNLGEALAGMGEYGEAAGLLRTAAAREPDRARTRYFYGLALEGLGRGEEAEKRYCEALARRTVYPEAQEALGTLLYSGRRYEEALTLFREASHSFPDDDSLRRKQGDTLLRLGKLEKAEEQYREAILLNPSNVKAHSNLGTVLFKQGRSREAVTSYGRALEVDPEFFMAWFNLANVLFKAGEAEEAIPLYDKALGLKPDHEKAREYRARALESLGRGEKGRGR